MKLRHCLIVEDSEPDVLLIKSYIKRYPLFQSVKTCTSYFEAIDLLSSEKFDLLFLDINLSDGSGLDLLNSSLNLPPTIIISSHSEYAIESYKIGKALDFLPKPFDYERFIIAIERALSINISKHSFKDVGFIFIKMGRTLQRFNFEEIDYIEAYTIYAKVIYNGTPFVVNEIISTLNELLDPEQFVRVHKSYIINIKKVTSIDSKNIWIDKTPVPIGKSYKSNFEGFMRLFDKFPNMN